MDRVTGGLTKRPSNPPWQTPLPIGVVELSRLVSSRLNSEAATPVRHPPLSHKSAINLVSTNARISSRTRR